ncbi:glycosyltransferase [Winogradskyella aurantia]|uniref:Glycosyltransferase n=1 Tax=Winogradskyella aurantia TaxID=1915063 RepID=A0A265UUN2_9FLAO|nr:glycosyltransferase [Winogradskyella aurantia]OZV69018.1 hypothetical protein CA834_06030 [Winogradskyella aurantia]
MTKTGTKKICIVVMSLGGGGAERASGLLSEVLDDFGFEVHVVSVLDEIEFPYKGKLFNLGKMKAMDDSVFGRLKRLNAFRKYLKSHDFDYVIDTRTRIGLLKEFILSRLVYNSHKTIYMVHSYNTNKYITSSRVLNKIMYGNAHKIVAVSEAIAKKLQRSYGFNNLMTIYNPIALHESSQSNDFNLNDNDYVLFYGRLNDEIKNITLLIEAYAKSILPKLDIKLKILGEGKDEGKLKTMVQKMSLTSEIEFLPYMSSPYQIVKKAKFSILTSRYEGFPMVLTESLHLGTPVISVDCESGPKEIIKNEHNGLLVENYNEKALTEAMNRMVKDEELYLNCKANATASVAHLSKKQIGLQWQSILK